MKAYLIDRMVDLDFTEHENGNKSSRFCFTFSDMMIQEGHSDCSMCKQFCTDLKNLIPKAQMDNYISALDISFVMKPTKQKFDVTMEGLLLHMLKNALKLADDVFLRLTLHPLRGARASDRLGLEDIETEKFQLKMEEGKCHTVVSDIKNWSLIAEDETYYTSFKIKVQLVIGKLEPLLKTEMAIQQPSSLELVSLYKDLFSNRIPEDLAISTADNMVLKCHKVFFEAHIPTFEAMLKKGQFLEGQEDLVNLDSMSFEAVYALKNFLYYRSVEQPSKNTSVAMELLTCADKYGIKCLQEAMWKIIMFKPTQWFDVKLALSLFFFGSQDERLVEFKQRAIQVLREKPIEELQKSEDYNELFKQNPKAAQELCTAFLANLSLNGCNL